MSYTEEEYDAYEKRMEERFPKMFAEPYGGFAIGSGWWKIIEVLCENIQSHCDWMAKQEKGDNCPQVIVNQIKEKFGGLRFYYSGGDQYVEGMVTMTEIWAGRTCEVCGIPGERRGGGWIRTLCDEHERERQKHMKRKNDD